MALSRPALPRRRPTGPPSCWRPRSSSSRPTPTARPTTTGAPRGVTELATAGPASTGPNFPNLTGMTSDGAAVFFYTRDALVASDTDTVEDAYMYRAGATTLLSPGPTACISSQSFPSAGVTTEAGSSSSHRIGSRRPTRIATPTSTSTTPARSHSCSRGRRASTFSASPATVERCSSSPRRRCCPATPMPPSTSTCARGLRSRSSPPDRPEETGLSMPSPTGCLPPATASLSGPPSNWWPRTRTPRSTCISGTRAPSRSYPSARRAATTGRRRFRTFPPPTSLTCSSAPPSSSSRTTPMPSSTSTTTRAARQRSYPPVRLVETARSLRTSSSTVCPRTAARSSS